MRKILLFSRVTDDKEMEAQRKSSKRQIQDLSSAGSLDVFFFKWTVIRVDWGSSPFNFSVCIELEVVVSFLFFTCVTYF